MCVGSFWDAQGRQIKIESLMGEADHPQGDEALRRTARCTVRSWRYEVTGVLKGGGESAYQVFIPDSDVQAISQWVTGKRINRNKDGYNRVIVRATDSKQVEAMQETIKSMGFNASSTKDDSPRDQSLLRSFCRQSWAVSVRLPSSSQRWASSTP